MPTPKQNLELAIIESLLWSDDVDTDKVSAHCRSRLSDIEDDPELSEELWGQPVPELVDFVLSQGLQEHFHRVTELDLDGGSEIYGLTSLFWSGEDDSYDISSFDGLEACENLVSIQASAMISMEDAVSLAPLADLPRLESVRFDVGALRDVEAVLKAPSLKQLEIGSFATLTGTTRKELAQRAKDEGILTNLP